MTTLNNLGGPIVGSDGIIPVYQPEGRWCWWGLHELYMGSVGKNRYVPKTGDYVMDKDTYTTFYVDHLDPVTLIPTLREIRPANMSFSFTETDVLFGVGPGTQSDTYRVYIDKSVMPHTMAVDARLKIGGTMSDHCKIFLGSDLSGAGKVISRVYDSAGTFISDSIKLELIALDSHVNYSIKNVPVCHTIDDLVDGEYVTAVFYSASGSVVSKRQLLVENTSFIRGVNASTKYVSHISVESPFLSPTLDHTIAYPINVPINALNMMGVVHYSDGSVLKLPIGSGKFKMLGLEQYISTIVGQQVEMVLSYALASNEIAYAGVTSDGHYVTEPYHLLTVNPNNSYTVKLFGYPVWVSEASGYTIQWWLLNLDRNIYFDVTPYVTFATNTGPFDPKLYGYVQRKSVSIKLSDVSGTFKPFTHTQIVEIVLNGKVSDSINPWAVSHESVPTRPNFGPGLFAKRVNGTSASTTLNVSSGLTTKDDWLKNVYFNTFPLMDKTKELTPPQPTHFILSYGGVDFEVVMTDWADDAVVPNNIPLYKNVTIRFIKRTSSGDLQLSIASLVVQP